MRPIQRLVLVVLAGAAAAAAAVGIQRQAGAPATPPAPARIATVDVFEVVSRLIESPEFRSVQEAAVKQWTDQIEPLEAELRVGQEKLQALAPDDPQRGDVQTRLGQQFQQYQSLQQQAQGAMEQLQLESVTEAYGRIAAAARAVAEREGYTYVLASRSEDKALELQNVFQEIMVRTVIVAPEGTEITQQVIQELNIPEPVPAEGQPGAADQPAAPEGGAPATPPASEPR